MNKFSLFTIVVSTIVLLAACTKAPIADERVESPKKEINITVIASEKPTTSPNTKTYLDGNSIKWAQTGEYIRVYEVAPPSATTQVTSAEGMTSNGGATMSFGVTLEYKSSDRYPSFDYYAFYPDSAYRGGQDVDNIYLTTKEYQTPSATSFDSSQDLLIAQKVENGSSQATTLEMQFARVVALGKMTICNLETTEPITTITFSAKVGNNAVPLAGATKFSLETAQPVSSYGSGDRKELIILDYSGQGITADSPAGMVAYFICYPFAINAATPGSFKVVVETVTQSFEKEVSVSSAKGLAFTPGKTSVFTVDMNNISGEIKPQAVDLGLSVKWASCNLGASNPEEFGDYYAWGELEPKEDYSFKSYKWYTGSMSQTTIIKYNTDSSYGPVDNKTELDAADDVAHIRLGDKWHIPSDVEWNELRTNCLWDWVTVNNVKGYRVTSKRNGNSIFLPAAGYKWDTYSDRVGLDGYYWTSSLQSNAPTNAWRQSFGADVVEVYHGNSSSNYRVSGQPIRPVSE